VVVVSVLLSVAVSALLLWAVGSRIRDDVREEAKVDLKAETQSLRKQDAEAAKFNNTQQKAIENHEKSLVALRDEKEALKNDLKGTVQTLVKSQKTLVVISKRLDKFITAKDNVDAKQNETIGDNSRRIHYIEEKLKKLKAIESDVMALKSDTGNLKGQYVVLKKDLETVSKKGDVTEQEMARLGERARLFQLRVLAARAREAAEAARQGDLKKLLARLTEGE